MNSFSDDQHNNFFFTFFYAFISFAIKNGNFFFLSQTSTYTQHKKREFLFKRKGKSRSCGGKKYSILLLNNAMASNERGGKLRQQQAWRKGAKEMEFRKRNFPCLSIPFYNDNSLGVAVLLNAMLQWMKKYKRGEEKL